MSQFVFLYALRVFFFVCAYITQKYVLKNKKHKVARIRHIYVEDTPFGIDYKLDISWYWKPEEVR